MLFNQAAFGLTNEQIAQITQQHPATIRRYRRTNQAPYPIIQLISIYRNGIIPSLHSSWDGWQFRDEILADPIGNEFTANQIQGVWITRQLQAEFERMKRSPVQYLMF